MVACSSGWKKKLRQRKIEDKKKKICREKGIMGMSLNFATFSAKTKLKRISSKNLLTMKSLPL